MLPSRIAALKLVCLRFFGRSYLRVLNCNLVLLTLVAPLLRLRSVTV
jgi:hypothetical protein